MSERDQSKFYKELNGIDMVNVFSNMEETNEF